MKRCQICRKKQVKVLLDFGPQPISNRFKHSLDEDDFFHPLILGQCQSCGLIQLTDPVPPMEIIPRVDWLKYSEPEAHLDDLADVLCSLDGLPNHPTACGITYKDDSLLRRLQEKGFNTWRVDPNQDLGISQRGIAGETVIPLMTQASVKKLKKKYGDADLIVARHILEHAPDTQKFLKAINGILCPRAYIAFEVPDCRKQLQFRDYTMPWEEHVLYFVPETLRASFQYVPSYKLVDYRSYPYVTEDSQVAIVRETQDTENPPQEPSKSESQQEAEAYAADFEEKSERIVSFLRDFCLKRGKVAIYGAGHLSVMLINSLKIEGSISTVVDDTLDKHGWHLPGTSIGIQSSAALEKEGITLCILCLSVEHEQKIMEKHRTWIDGGGVFVSAFPMQEHSLLRMTDRKFDL